MKHLRPGTKLRVLYLTGTEFRDECEIEVFEPGNATVHYPEECETDKRATSWDNIEVIPSGDTKEPIQTWKHWNGVPMQDSMPEHVSLSDEISRARTDYDFIGKEQK